MPYPTILILENDRAIADDLSGHLFNLGYPLLPVMTKEQDAEEVIKAGYPDLILVGLHFGGPQAGLQTARRIREDHGLPVIFIIPEKTSGVLNHPELQEAYGYIFSPVNNTCLHATLEMAGNQYRRQKLSIENKTKLSAILKSASDGIITVDNQGLILSLNPAAIELTGLSEVQAIGSSLDNVVIVMEKSTQEQIRATDLVHQRRSTGPLSGFEILLIGPSGNKIPVEGTVAPLRVPGGNRKGAVVALRSISEIQYSMQRIKTQAARSEALLRIIEMINSHLNIEDMLASLLKEASQILDADAAAVFLDEADEDDYRLISTYSLNEKLAGYRDQMFKVNSQSIGALMTGDQAIVCIPNIQAQTEMENKEFIIQEDIRTIILARLKREDHLLGIMTMITCGQERDYTSEEILFIKVLADQASLAIDKAQLFKRLLSSRSRLQKMARRLVDVQESERRAVARELHDQVGQVLTGLQFSLESAKRQADGNLRTTLEESQQLVTSLMQQIRELSLKLVPSMMDDMGLLRTLLWHFEQYSNQTGIQVRFMHTGLEKRFSSEIEITAYRIIQEALTNVARYAKVDQVDVEINSNDKVLNLLVRDMGGGFDPQKTVKQKSTFGLTSMKERAALVGGELNIKSVLGAGTELLVTLPISETVERRHHERKGFAGG
jgi:PAS domain S-box-containing protein